MSIHNYYLQIAKENNLDFTLDDKYFSGKTFLYDVGTISVDYYTFQKKVNNVNIVLKNELGSTNLGSATCTIPNKPGLHEFGTEISNVFWTIFNKKKDRIKVYSKNEKTKEDIQYLLKKTGIQRLCKELNFEPAIQFVYEKNTWILKLDYSLQFSGKEQAILPIFKFYEEFITKHVRTLS